MLFNNLLIVWPCDGWVWDRRRNVADPPCGLIRSAFVRLRPLAVMPN